MTQWLLKIGSKDIRNIIAVMVVIGAFVLAYFFMIKEIPKENRDIVMVVAGSIFGGALQGVLGYYFGSSKVEGDKAKSDNEGGKP